MIKPKGVKGLEDPQGFAHVVNANKNGKFTKSGYGLNINGVALNAMGVNALKSR